jgi:hypothetical protein
MAVKGTVTALRAGSPPGHIFPEEDERNGSDSRGQSPQPPTAASEGQECLRPYHTRDRVTAGKPSLIAAARKSDAPCAVASCERGGRLQYGCGLHSTFLLTRLVHLHAALSRVIRTPVLWPTRALC